MESESVRACLEDIGCSPDQICQITACVEADQLAEARQRMRRLRCGLMDAMHESQRRLDQLDWLIRTTESRMNKK